MRRDILGRSLEEFVEEPRRATITTHVPSKWLLIDTETTDVWTLDRDGHFRRANVSSPQIAAAKRILKNFS